MKQPNYLPVEAKNPIPNPTNERQMLCIYIPQNDNDHCNCCENCQYECSQDI